MSFYLAPTETESLNCGHMTLMENFIKAVVPLRQMIHQKRTTAFHAVVPKLASYGGCVCFQGHYTPLSYQRLSLPSPATMSSLSLLLSTY